MISTFHSKKILKPDMPPQRIGEGPGSLGKGLIVAAIGAACAAGLGILVLYRDLSASIIAKGKQIMKKLRPIVALLLGMGVSGCAQLNPVPREQVEANLAPMLKVEKRADRVKYYTEMLVVMDGMSRENAQKLKATYDVYYIYYVAASVHLAGGNLESYLAHVKLAEKELDAMEAILRRDLAKLTELEKERKQRLFRSGL